MKTPVLLLVTLCVCLRQASAYDSTVIINEIQYAPAAGQTEWIELRNLNGVDVSVAGWTLSGGIDFKLPATGTGSIIPGGGYLVIAATPAQIPGSIGPFTGQLDNGGETIRLRNLNGRVMDEVSYDDDGEWPVGADGSGATLSRRLANAAEGAGAWAASTQLGGSPGTLNFPAGEAQNRTHISTGTSWKYTDAVDAPAADWKDPAFAETGWSTGNAALGAQEPVTSLTVTASLVERFRASDITGVANGGVVTTWTDTANGAGFGDAVAQNATGANSPTLQTNVVNGKPVVRFPNTGTGEMRTAVQPGIGATSGWVVFAVAKANTTLTNGQTTDGAGDYLLDRNIVGFSGNPLMSIKAVGGRWGLQKRNDASAGLGGPTSTTNISTSAFQIIAIRRNRSLNQFEIWVDGVLEGTAADDGSALTPSPLVIAHHATAGSVQGFKGDIAEVLVYKDELSGLDFQKVGAYLETEYGLNTAFQAVATTLAAAAPTCYFRKSFNFPGDPLRTSLRLNHTVADGAVFYLNGTELLRANMPAGAVDHSTAASSIIAAPAATGFVAVPSSALVNGTNVLAVSLHKGPGGTSSYFDAALESTELPADPDTAAALRFNEITAASAPSFYIELQNISGAALNTAGWTVGTSTGQTVALPAQIIPTGGLITVDAVALGFTPADGTRLYLLAPGGTQLRDAREVTNRLRGLTADGRWGHPDSATPGAANVVTVNGDIVINEIFYNAVDDSPEQWIELHNKGAASVDISGWKFSDGVSFDFPSAPPTVIPAGGYLVVAWDPALFAPLHPGVAALGPFGGSLSGKGETITLRDANGNVADQVTYADGGRWSQWADGGGSSLELIDPDADNSKGEAWDASDESSFSTWQNVSISGPATNTPSNNPTNWNEFLFGLLNAGEFLIDDISVVNTTTATGNLIQNGDFSGGTTNFWRIIGTHSGSVVSDGGNNVLKVVATAETEHMHNHAGTTLKSGATFHTINAAQTYSITFRAKWLRGSNQLHSRLYTNRLALKTVLNRPSTGGTPGAVNSRFVANIGPTFDGLLHAPAVPTAGLPATVTVKVADPDGLASVQLFTSIGGAAFTSTPMTSTDGSTYTGTVPGQTAGTVVLFYVHATDTPGAVSFYPAGGPASRAMIQWDDGRAALTLASGAKPHNIRVIMPGADANTLYRHENLMSNAAMPCTVIYDEKDIYYRAGVSLKSSEHGRFNIARVGYNIEFPPDDLFLGTHGGISVDRSGGTVTGQKEILLKQLSILAGGIHAPQDDIVRLIPARATGTGFQFDGSGMLGAAILSKTRLKRDYLDNQWENGGDGMMFKYERIYVLTQTINPVTRVVDASVVPENPKIPQDSTSPPGVNVTNLGTNSEFYRWHWLVEGGRDADNYVPIMNLTSAMGQAAGATFNNLVNQQVDVNAWLRAFVPGALFGVTDCYTAPTGNAQHNVLFYFPPGRKAVMFPWDQDFLAQSNPTTTSLTGGGGGDLNKFLANPAWKRLYWGHMLDVLNRAFNTPTMTQWATHYQRFGTDEMVNSSVVNYLTPRANYALSQVSAQIPFAAFTRTSADNITVTTPFTTVTGNGWVNIAEIRLQGSAEPLAVTWTGQSTWSLQLPVSAGTNTYTLIPYDSNGVQLTNNAANTGTPMSATVTVTGTGGIFPAGPGNLVVSELHYNPAGTTDDTEFIELLNITGTTLDLGGCHFDEENGQGISYTFASGVQVPAGGRILVARNRTAFLAAYPTATPVAAGEFNPTALDNGGETLVLYAASGLEIFRFTYNDNLNSTDGGGRSLVRVVGCTPDANDYTWRASMADGGNPGGSDAIMFTGNPLDDLDHDGVAAIIEYAFGTSDTVWNPSTDFLTINGSATPLPATPLPNADCAITEFQASDDLIDWTGATSPARRFWRWKVTLR